MPVAGDVYTTAGIVNNHICDNPNIDEWRECYINELEPFAPCALMKGS